MTRLCIALAILPIAAAAIAQPPREPLVRNVPIEQPDALRAIGDALSALERDPSRRVRVLHYGDSNVAADLWTAVARAELQRRYGDGGSGYLLPPGHGSAHRGAVTITAEGPWESRRRGFVRDFGPTDGLWGLAGVAIEARGPGARIAIDVPDAGVPHDLEVHLLARPRPGAIDVRVDDRPPVRLDAEQDRPGLVMRRFELETGAHRVRVGHAGGVPRLLGVVVERRSGVVYDVLGINGHRASAILSWDEDLLRAQLRHRRPDLVVLSYGGNEALDPDLPMTTYEERARRAIARVRSLAPDASCLLVGPLATFPEHARRMRGVTAVQRRLAPELGCAFWDSSALSGGPGTLDRWARHPGMVSRDRLHLGRTGYERVGRAFADALLAAVRPR